ncbi:MAG: hypothetical protein ACOCVM_07220 [Desulfovibrionaceae bacterium]
MSNDHAAMTAQPDSGCGEDHAVADVGQPSAMQGQPAGAGSPAMGQPQAPFPGQAPSMGQSMGQPPAPGQYMGQVPAGGPDMGQPHFSAQIPGAAPYQGQPGAMAYGQPPAGYFAMGEQQGQGVTPGGQPSGQPLGGFVQPGGQPGAWGQFPGQPQPGGQFPGQPPFTAYGYAPGFQPGQPGPAAAMPGQGQGYENRYGELYGLINEAADGNPDVSKFLNFFTQSSTDFWKGAALGAGLALLLTNDRVKGAVAGAFSGVWGAFGKSAEQMEEEEDRKAEAEFAKQEKE